MIGKTIGKYRIIGQLGRGGMGTVYKAIDDTLEREVAIKVLNPELADSQVIGRFRQEAITLAKLSHPEIATIYELLRSEADLLMVMELVRGETLDSICRRLSGLPPEHAVYLTGKILSALGHAHSAGIVHCDMKPANVMVTRDGSVKIMDFGIARVRGSDHTTPHAQMIGTPAYMPPEQALGREVDARSDLYSVGIILYRLLTGAVPFNAPTPIGVVQQQISDAPAPLEVHREGLPEWCEPILRRALAKSQADRFQTAEEFRETLHAAAGTPTPEAARAFFGSVCDVETAAAPQTGVLERLGITRIWASASTTSAAAATMSSLGSSATRGIAATVVLPRRRWHMTAALIVAPVAIVGAIGVAGWWRQATSVSSTLPPVARPGYDVVLPAALTAKTSLLESPISASPLPESSARVPPGPPPIPVPARRANVPDAVPYAFDAMTLVSGGDRPRERASQVFLINGMINVKASDDDSLLYALPLDSILSITYSDGRDPLWKGPDGPSPVARGPMGLGIFRGPRRWVSLHTEAPDARFVVLRVSSAERARSAVAALEQRTGHDAVMLADDFK